jgi:hypothetical protein
MCQARSCRTARSFSVAPTNCRELFKTQLRRADGRANSDLVVPNPPKRITAYKIAAGPGYLLYVLISTPQSDKTVVVAVAIEIVADDDFVIVDVGNYGGRGTRKINPYVTTIAQEEPVS